jgi:hypothetical protein
MTPAFSSAREAIPPESVLRQLRIPFVRRATMLLRGAEEDVFLIDIGMAGAFVERAEALSPGEGIEIRFPWWHPRGGALSSKSLPPGAGLQFVDMSEPDRVRLRALLVDYCRQHPRVRRFLRHWPDAEHRSDDPTDG